MCFVGRKKEIRIIIKALEKDTNIVLSGKYGIGRTALIKHIAKIAQDRWRFFYLDFSQTPGEVCNALLKKLFPDYCYKKRHRYEHYKRSRLQIQNLALPDKRKHILIVDNIAKLSPHKIKLLNYLATEKRFGPIAIVEQYIPEPDLLRLRVALSPVIRLTLTKLNIRTTQEFFRQYSLKYHLNLTANRIKVMSEITNGYPLGMKEFLYKEFPKDTKKRPNV